MTMTPGFFINWVKFYVPYQNSVSHVRCPCNGHGIVCLWLLLLQHETGDLWYEVPSSSSQRQNATCDALDIIEDAEAMISLLDMKRPTLPKTPLWMKMASLVLITDTRSHWLPATLHHNEHSIASRDSLHASKWNLSMTTLINTMRCSSSWFLYKWSNSQILSLWLLITKVIFSDCVNYSSADAHCLQWTSAEEYQLSNLHVHIAVYSLCITGLLAILESYSLL